MLAQSCEGHDTSTKTLVFSFCSGVADSSRLGWTSVAAHRDNGTGVDPLICTLYPSALRPSTTSAAVPALGTAATVPARPRAAAPSATTASGVMMKVFMTQMLSGQRLRSLEIVWRSGGDCRRLTESRREPAPVDLSDAAARQFVDEMDLSWRCRRRQPRGDVRAQFL